MNNKRVFSGVQPTGNLHLGNYLGAIRNWVKMQAEYECIYCIVDLHAITLPQDPKALLESTRKTAAAYIACGIDPKKSIIFNQSAVPGHAELAWILGCHTPLGWLNRMTQFKEKVKNLSSPESAEADSRAIQLDSPRIASGNSGNDTGDESSKANLGLYSYPVLMAADVLLYKATHVPVGEDQKQHLELARDIAGAFNRAYPVSGERCSVPGKDAVLTTEGYFPLPEPMILGDATRVMSLRDGTAKMSKSDESDYSRVNLTDDADMIAKKFKKAKSDSEMGFHTLENRPEALNLLTIYATLEGTSVKKAQEKFKDSGFGALKKELAEVAVEKLAPISNDIHRLMDDTAYLDTILKDGAERAGTIAERHMKEIRTLIGFLG